MHHWLKGRKKKKMGCHLFLSRRRKEQRNTGTGFVTWGAKDSIVPGLVQQPADTWSSPQPEHIKSKLTSFLASLILAESLTPPSSLPLQRFLIPDRLTQLTILPGGRKGRLIDSRTFLVRFAQGAHINSSPLIAECHHCSPQLHPHKETDNKKSH